MSPSSLDLMNLLREIGPDHHQFRELVLGHLNFGFPNVGRHTLCGPVRILVRIFVGLADCAPTVIVFAGGAPPVADKAPLRGGSDEVPKGQCRVANSAGHFLLPSLQTLLKWLPASPVASLPGVVGHECTDGGLSWFILVVIIVKTFAAFGSRQVHDGLPVRPRTDLVHAAVASLQPAVVGEVLVLFEYFLFNPFQHDVAAHPRQEGLQKDRLAAHLTLVEAPDYCLLAIPRDGDEEGAPQGLPLEVPGHLGSSCGAPS